MNESEEVSDEDDCIGEESISHSTPSSPSGLGAGATLSSDASTLTFTSTRAVGGDFSSLPPTEVSFGDSVRTSTSAGGCEKLVSSITVVAPSDLPFSTLGSSTLATLTPSCPASAETGSGASVCPLTRIG